MNKLFFGSIAGLAITLSAVTYAAATDSEQLLRERQMEECFQAHASLMEKPAVRNRVNCWMAHRHLMQRQVGKDGRDSEVTSRPFPTFSG